jgi:hypothetical protein
MDSNLPAAEINRQASIELNLLHFSRTFPPTFLRDARLQAGTPIHDTNGDLLFVRFPIDRGGEAIGYADVAAHTLFGAPLLAVAPHAIWDEQSILAQAQQAFRQRNGQRRRHHHSFDEMRFVAYSFPKIAVQFLLNKQEVAMLECFTWIDVPPAEPRAHPPMEPGNFERWSLIDEFPASRKEENHRRFEQRVDRLSTSEVHESTTGHISTQLLPANISITTLTRSYELHYSGRTSDHHVCYELRGQQTNVWCVAASVQMLLDFYRYNYAQTKIADRLGLGTLASPSGLPYGQEDKVVQQLEDMSSNALSAAKTQSPSFADYTAELDQNRPLISFIPGHSRTVAGYTESLLRILGLPVGFRGLLVYDPWPPNAGVITRWENYDTQTYRFAFSAHVTTI